MPVARFEGLGLNRFLGERFLFFLCFKTNTSWSALIPNAPDPRSYGPAGFDDSNLHISVMYSRN